MLRPAPPRTLSARTLSARTLSARTLSARTLSARALSARALSARTLSARTLSARTLSARTLSARTLWARALSARALSARTLSARTLSARTLSARALSALVFLAFVILAGCGRSAGRDEASQQVIATLQALTFQQVEALGPHRWESRLSLASEANGRRKEIQETQVLEWDSWAQYHHQVLRAKLTTLDVTLWQGRAYQRQPDGRIRIREDLEELHYYLRQTWNSWDGALKPFESVIFYEPTGSDQHEGRPVDCYRIQLRPQIDPDAAREGRLRQAILHDRLEGLLWLDASTRVPVRMEFEGRYRLTRFARRPGQEGESTTYQVQLAQSRSRIGKTQLSEPPLVVARP